MSAQPMFQLACGLVLVVWLAALAMSQTFGGWIHVLPLGVLLAVAARVGYLLLTLD